MQIRRKPHLPNGYYDSSKKRRCSVTWTFIICKDYNFKGKAQFFQKGPLNLWWISNKTIMEVGNIKKAAACISFLHLSYKNIITFCVTVLFNISTRQSLTDDFLGLHKNMTWAFALT